MSCIGPPVGRDHLSSDQREDQTRSSQQDRYTRHEVAAPRVVGPSGRTQKQKSLRNQQRLFLCNQLQRQELGLNLQEDDDERKQRERLDRRKTENQEDKDSRTCPRVARQRLGGRSRRLTLTQAAKTSCKGHTQTGSQRNPLRCGRVVSCALRKSRRCKQHRGQRHKQILQLLHCVTPASVKYSPSGWLILPFLPPSPYSSFLTPRTV